MLEHDHTAKGKFDFGWGWWRQSPLRFIEATRALLLKTPNLAAFTEMTCTLLSNTKTMAVHPVFSLPVVFLEC